MKKLTLAALAVAALLSACGGGGGDAPATEPSGGIWMVDATVNGVHVTGRALITEFGDLVSYSTSSNGCGDIAVGAVAFDGDVVVGNDLAILTNGCVFTDGSNYGIQRLNGTLNRGSTLTFSSTTTTGNGTVFGTPAVTATFNPLYKRPSSLSKLVGNWMFPDGHFESINSAGVVTQYDPASNCSFTGQVSIIDAKYNAYSLSNTASGCVGSAAVLNGHTAHAIMSLDDTVSPNLLYSGGQVTVGNVKVNAVVVLQR